MLRILSLFIALLATPPVAAAGSASTACDHLAGTPMIPPTKRRGAFDAIDLTVALMSCAAAYSEQPGVVRHKYQYGRALLAANQPSEVPIFIRSAANSGYAAAQQSLATILYDGENFSADKIAAIRLFHKAAAQDHTVAQLRIAFFYLRGEGDLPDLSKAMKFALQAAYQSLPAFRTTLEVIVGALGAK